MNVLLTCAGRRGSLLKAFREAAAAYGGQVFAGDSDALAPALFLADQGLILPGVQDSDYIPTLLDIVERHRIRVVVPTIDTELPILADAADAFQARGCRSLISSPRMVEISGDKWLTARVFAAEGLRVPGSWLPGDECTDAVPERLFVKPRNGSASQHAQAVLRDQLASLLPHVPNPIIQEEIRAPEITVDALLDLEGRPIHYVPRLRIRTLAGESIQGVTLPDTDIGPWLQQVLQVVSRYGARGPVTLQAFLTDGDPTLSEINPRFGGGFPLTLAAGGHYPAWILQMVAGETVTPRLGSYKPHLYMTRYYTEHFTEEPRWT